MSTYHISSIRLLLIMIVFTIFWYYFLGLPLGYGIVILPVTVGYTIYRNFKAAQSEKHESEQN